jgi:hypothetical protein
MGNIVSCPDFILSNFQETEYIYIVVFMLQADINKFHTRLCSNSASCLEVSGSKLGLATGYPDKFS